MLSENLKKNKFNNFGVIELYVYTNWRKPSLKKQIMGIVQKRTHQYQIINANKSYTQEIVIKFTF